MVIPFIPIADLAIKCHQNDSLSLSLSLSTKKTILKRETKRFDYKNITEMDNIEKQAQNYGKQFTSSFLCKGKLFNTLKQYFLSYK